MPLYNSANKALSNLNNLGVAGQVLTSNGPTTAPTFQTASSGTVLTAIPFPWGAVTSGAGTQTGFGTNTTQSLYMFNLPQSITVNKISIKTGGTVTTSGTFDIVIYSENGQTQEISVTTGSITTGDTIYSTAVGGVTLSAGNHWFSIVPNSTASSQFYCYTTGTNAALGTTVSLATDVTGEPIIRGTLTVTASTPATTFDPTAVTEDTITNVGIVFRLDN